MAKTYNSMEEFQKDFDKNLEKIQTELTKGKALEQTGKEMIEIIQKRTKAGFGVDRNEGSKSKLKPLSDAYKKQRKSFRKKGKLSNNTSPAKSNLTLSGDMLESLEAKQIKNGVRVQPTGQDNEDKAKWNAKTGRSFLFLSKAETKRLTEKIDLALNKIINKLF